MTNKPKWTDLKPIFESMPSPALVALVKDLFDASADNQAFLSTRFLSQAGSEAVLEPYRKRITDQFYPKRGFGKLNLREARKAITDYRKATRDDVGTLELMLTYVESGTSFTRDYGDINESFYRSLASVFGEFARLLQKNPARYPFFEDRLRTVARQASLVGWGYDDLVMDIVTELGELSDAEAGSGSTAEQP